MSAWVLGRAMRVSETSNNTIERPGRSRRPLIVRVRQRGVGSAGKP